MLRHGPPTDHYNPYENDMSYRRLITIVVAVVVMFVRQTEASGPSLLPSGKEILAADLRSADSDPMQIVSVTASQQVAPVLIRNETNPVLDVKVVTRGSLRPGRVTQLRIDLTGTTDLGDIETLEVFATGRRMPDWRAIDANRVSLQRFGKPQPARRQIVFQGEIALVPGTNHFFVSVKLRPAAKLGHRIAASCDTVVAESRYRPTGTPAPVGQRIGYAVRRANDDNARVYRIPGLVTTKRGTLIGVYDVRYRGWGDLPNDIDVGMSRSSDGGQTWDPMQIIIDMGDDPQWRYDGVGDPSVLVDQVTGTIWVAGTWSHGDRSWVGSGPGLEPEETGQLMLVHSDDDGLSWSKPANITKQVKDPRWSFLLQGPGRGITMHDGTLVFPAQYQDSPEKDRLPRSTILFSTDHGETWACGTGAYDNTTESAVVEIEPGVLMLNCRYDLQNRRVVMITRDLGRTWQEHPTSRKTLPEPGACMASLLNTVSYPVDRRGEKPILLFSNPNVEAGPRRRMTIKVSDDRGMTWPTNWQMLIDEGVSAGYSCLTMVDEQHVGILFEGSRAHMTYLSIPLSELHP